MEKARDEYLRLCIFGSRHDVRFDCIHSSVFWHGLMTYAATKYARLSSNGFYNFPRPDDIK